MQLIWKATVEYIHEKLLQGKGVNIPNFGAFTFSIETELPRIGSINPNLGDINEQRLERHHLHKNYPIFVPDASLQYVLSRYHGKNFLEKPASQSSIYQRGFQMIYCNPVPISMACYLEKNVVRDTHNAIFKAIKDLAKLGRTLHIPFDFAVIAISNLALDARFSKNFTRQVNEKGYEFKMRRSDDPCATFWKTTTQAKWRQSTLSHLWTAPSQERTQNMNEKTLALKIMSLDLASTIRPHTTAN
mmetsp:Transcript_8986/g.8947  ORF Transcript_8986/g.8947 Transcript_8986/m.8947 type:complete len:245 (+) Transcript_8986:120-854(+)